MYGMDTKKEIFLELQGFFRCFFTAIQRSSEHWIYSCVYYCPVVSQGLASPLCQSNLFSICLAGFLRVALV